MIFYLISITITGFVCYVYGMACLKLLKNLFKEDGTNISMPIVLLLGMFLVSSIFTLYSFVLPLNASAFSVAILVSFLLVGICSPQ